MSDELKWRWKMGYCKGRGISPAQEWAWAEAEQAYLAKMEEAPQDTKVQNGHIAQQPQERHCSEPNGSEAADDVGRDSYF